MRYVKIKLVIGFLVKTGSEQIFYFNHPSPISIKIKEIRTLKLIPHPLEQRE